MAERRTEQVMGTAVTIEVRDEHLDTRALDDAFAWLAWVDATFSTYDPESEISRLNDGRLALADAHPAVARVLAQCEELRGSTGGYFDVHADDPARVDPSGLVKGWAVDGALAGLRRSGAHRVCIEAGGDVRVAGGDWRVGIRHPFERERLAAVLWLDDGAVATSGTYERGAHIIDPHTRRPPSGVLSVTVVSRTLAAADARATAAFAMGEHGPRWTASGAAMTILADASVLVTPEFARLRV